MDAVPWKFVDSVVDLFSKETLDRLQQEVRHRHWKPVIDLHHRNRVYHKLIFKKRQDGIKHAIVGGNGNVDLSLSRGTVIKSGRFARILEISDFTSLQYDSFLDKMEPLKDAETATLLKTVAPLVDQVSGRFYSSLGCVDCTRLLLTSLFKRVYLQQITVKYCGQIAYDFLEDQINNSPFLNDVRITGNNWPQSSLSLIKKFCSKGRPGRRVNASVSCSDLISGSYMQHLLDLWKKSGNAHFRFNCVGGRTDEEYRAAVKKYEVFEIRNDSWQTAFRHPTTKSIARVSKSKFAVECSA
uniref:F-box domain-containing protein n=1 Tax=Steinernema glaseri TaxID=37863 RepID=A0A1I8AAG7_9BILA